MNDTMTIDSNSIIDLSLKYNLASKINLTLNAINLLNKKYLLEFLLDIAQVILLEFME